MQVTLRSVRMSVMLFCVLFVMCTLQVANAEALRGSIRASTASSARSEKKPESGSGIHAALTRSRDLLNRRSSGISGAANAALSSADAHALAGSLPLEALPVWDDMDSVELYHLVSFRKQVRRASEMV